MWKYTLNRLLKQFQTTFSFIKKLRSIANFCYGFVNKLLIKNTDQSYIV